MYCMAEYPAGYIFLFSSSLSLNTALQISLRYSYTIIIIVKYSHHNVIINDNNNSQQVTIHNGTAAFLVFSFFKFGPSVLYPRL